jgi:hypothetical protein
MAGLADQCIGVSEKKRNLSRPSSYSRLFFNYMETVDSMNTLTLVQNRTLHSACFEGGFDASEYSGEYY